jgi:conjugative transfer signal peptidase TraF
MTCPGSETGSRRGYRLAMSAGGALMLGIALAGVVGLRVNATASMPQGIWQVEAPGPLIGRGEIVSVCLPQSPALNEAAERGYIPAGACPGGHEPLVKPVAAVAGDRVTVTALGIAVNGEPVAQSAPLDEDSAGRPLRPVPAGAYSVRAGEVWLLSGHDPRSFDSRYFGAVPVTNIQGVARPIWVVE